MIEWFESKIEERTTWDGAMLIAVGGVILILGPLAQYAAWVAIGYGAWTLWKDE